jgi:hypothetical protein
LVEKKSDVADWLEAAFLSLRRKCKLIEVLEYHEWGVRGSITLIIFLINQQTMKDTISFLNLAEIMMEKTKRPLSSYEVWDEAQKSGESKKVKTEGKTPWQTIGAAIYYDMQSNASTIFYQYSK